MLPENRGSKIGGCDFRVMLPEIRQRSFDMVEVCEGGAPVAVSGWVLTDGHDLAPCAANGLHRVTMSVCNVIGGTGTLGIA